MPKMHLEGSGRQNVMVLHGWCLDSSLWKWAKLYTDTARFTYAYVDFPGYGLDYHARPLVSMDEMARHVLQAADELGWYRFRVVGHDMGGLAALRAATLEPRRFEKMALLTPFPADGTELDEETQAEYETAWPATRALFARLSPDLALDQANDLERLSRITGKRDAWERYLATWRSADFLDALGGLKVPTRFILAADDPLVTEALLRRTIDALPYADVIEIERTGHFAVVERPREVVQAWERFLREEPRSELQHGPPRLA